MSNCDCHGGNRFAKININRMRRGLPPLSPNQDNTQYYSDNTPTPNTPSIWMITAGVLALTLFIGRKK